MQLTTLCVIDVNEPSLSVSHNSIHASWQLDSKKCPSITTNFTWDVTCKETGSTSSLKGSCTENSCEFSNLKFFTEFTCEFVAAYEKKPFHTTTKTTKTWPGKPTLKGSKITATTMNHNTIKVTCEIGKWNGDKGVFNAELYIDNIHTGKEKTNEQCAFTFDDLYYLTEYEVKVYARNRNGNKSGPYTDRCSIKC
ncbi:hypothetical protein AMELA_G00141980, partial [Ameiurus melas]